MNGTIDYDILIYFVVNIFWFYNTRVVNGVFC